MATNEAKRKTPQTCGKCCVHGHGRYRRVPTRDLHELQRELGGAWYRCSSPKCTNSAWIPAASRSGGAA